MSSINQRVVSVRKKRLINLLPLWLYYRQLVQNWWQQHQQHHHRYAISDNDDDDFIRHKAFSPSSPPPPPPSSSSQPPFSSHWPQLASRQRASLRSPTLPDEELNSMLQSYLDEKFPQQNNKMDYDTGEPSHLFQKCQK